jgi:hypothetical protein
MGESVPPQARKQGEEAMLKVLKRQHPNVYWRISDEAPIITYPGLDPATGEFVAEILDAVGEATDLRASTDQAKVELGLEPGSRRV